MQEDSAEGAALKPPSEVDTVQVDAPGAGKEGPAGPSLDTPFGSPERVRQPLDADQQEEIHRRALQAATVASDLKAEDIRVLDMRPLVTYTDYLVICTGRSTRQTRRISEEIGLHFKRELRLLPLSVQGDAAGDWVLMDYLDFIVHIFTPETRDFYRLDVMWKGAPAETVDGAGVVVAEVRGVGTPDESVPTEVGASVPAAHAEEVHSEPAGAQSN